jgi:hypothetical protein
VRLVFKVRTHPAHVSNIAIPRLRLTHAARSLPSPLARLSTRPGPVVRQYGRRSISGWTTRDLVGASSGRNGLICRLTGRGGCLGEPSTKRGGMARPAGHTAVPRAVLL